MNKDLKFSFKDLVKQQDNSIVSHRVIENKVGGVTAFAFDKGQRLSEHSAPFDALVSVIDGVGEILIDGTSYNLCEGESIVMPANIPHAVNANESFKMVLTMIRG